MYKISLVPGFVKEIVLKLTDVFQLGVTNSAADKYSILAQSNSGLHWLCECANHTIALGPRVVSLHTNCILVNEHIPAALEFSGVSKDISEFLDLLVNTESGIAIQIALCQLLVAGVLTMTFCQATTPFCLVSLTCTCLFVSFSLSQPHLNYNWQSCFWSERTRTRTVRTRGLYSFSLDLLFSQHKGLSKTLLWNRKKKKKKNRVPLVRVIEGGNCILFCSEYTVWVHRPVLKTIQYQHMSCSSRKLAISGF